MPQVETKTLSMSHFDVIGDWHEQPAFYVRKMIPQGMNGQIEDAVRDFIVASHLPDGIDAKGFFNQTLQAIANAAVLNGAGDFWMGTLGNELLIYGLAHVANDLDGRLAYVVTQTWVRRDYRGRPVVKEWWAKMKERGRECFCHHMVIMSSRNFKAYERWLGDGMKLYATMLRQDL